MKKRVINFNDDTEKSLIELKSILQMPINKIIATIVNEKIESLNKINKEYLLNVHNIKSANNKQILLRISEQERIFLENQILKNGNKSLTSEIRYRLLNTIYKNKYFLPVELDILRDLIFQIKRIGLNINGIYKKINLKKELGNDDYSNFNNSINEVNLKLDEISKEIKKIIEFTNNRD